jgi:hypothetical protein
LLAGAVSIVVALGALTLAPIASASTAPAITFVQSSGNILRLPSGDTEIGLNGRNGPDEFALALVTLDTPASAPVGAPPGWFLVHTFPAFPDKQIPPPFSALLFAKRLIPGALPRWTFQTSQAGNIGIAVEAFRGVSRTVPIAALRAGTAIGYFLQVPTAISRAPGSMGISLWATEPANAYDVLTPWHETERTYSDDTTHTGTSLDLDLADRYLPHTGPSTGGILQAAIDAEQYAITGQVILNPS